MYSLLALDERESGVERSGDRLAWLVVSYGLLAIVAWRSFVDGLASWDLLALVILGGAVSFGYRIWHRAVTRQAVVVAGLTVLAALVVAGLVLLGSTSAR